jgi:LPS-assembly lipoprotein
MTMRLFLVLVLCTALTACGFHLRGQLPIPESISVIAVKSNEKDLHRRMTDALSFSGATVVSSTADAAALLDLHDVKYERSVRTIDDRGKVNGYLLVYRVNFTLVTAQGETLRDSTVFTRRDFNFDPDLVLQAEIEEESLREDMLTDLTQQILRQLATVTAALLPTGQTG